MIKAALGLILLMFAFAGQAQESDANVFEVDALHGSALNPPESMDLSTPRNTMRSFTQAIERYNFKAASAALGTTGGDDANRVELARKLGEIIDRQLWIDGGQLSDRPDALIETVGNNPRAGEAQRSIELGTIDLGRFPITIRLNRYKTADSDGLWLFSRESVEAVPALHKIYGPGWIEVRLPRWWRERSALSVRRWELAALPLLIAMCTCVGTVTNAGIGRLQRWAPDGWKSKALERAQMPLAIFTSALIAQTLINGALGFSGEITSVLTPILIAALVVALVMAMLRVIDAGLDMVSRRFVGEIDDRLGRDDRHFFTSIYALRRVVTLVAFLFGTALILWETGVFRNIGLSLLASAGVATVILGIAAQTVLGNILASLQIAFAKPIRIGDSVNYEGQWSYVEAIFYTFVRLRTWDDRRLIVPVQYFISHPFENWSMTDAKMTQTFYLVLDHMADTDALREKFLELANADEDVLSEESLKMQVLEQSADGLHCRFYATASDPSTAWDMHARLREDMLNWIRKEHPDWWPRERVKSLGKEDDVPDLDD